MGVSKPVHRALEAAGNTNPTHRQAAGDSAGGQRVHLATAPSLAQQLADAARNAAEGRSGALVVLRGAVERYVRELRARGEPPERVIVAVKERVRRGTGCSENGWTLPPEHGPAAVLDQVVRWAIELYYRE